jgi:hypothetical protein
VWQPELVTDANGKSRWSKVPYNPRNLKQHASTTDLSTWASFAKAVAVAGAGQESYPGIGFNLTGIKLVGIDLDGCRDPKTGKIAKWAWRIIRALNSYWEVSPSGTGVRIIVRGVLPPGRRRKNLPGDHCGIEMYDKNSPRYMTMTGVACGGNQIALRTQALARIHAELFPPEPETKANSTEAKSIRNGHAAAAMDTTRLSDNELIDKARKASNGTKFSCLFDGDRSGYASWSEADLALCSLLAFWTNCHASRMDTLFRQSGLMRPKWDEKHGASTYGQRTIDKAISGTTETYTPNPAAAVRPGKKGAKGASPTKATSDKVKPNGHATYAGMFDPPQPALDYVMASGVAAKPIDWTWEERIPKGMLTMFAGDAGQGKSLLLIELVAILTNPLKPGAHGVEAWFAKQFPDRAPLAKPGRVIMLCAEDSLESVIVPRLIAAGADLGRVVLLRGTILPDLEDENGEPRLTAFSLMRDLGHLQDLIRKLGDVSLVIIDPVTSYLDKVDSNSVHEVRGALLSMQVMVARANIAFVMLSHFNKTGHKTLTGIMGSQAFGAVPRAVYKALADQTDEGVRYFLPDRKNNLVDARDATALAYRLETVWVDSRDDTLVACGTAEDEAEEAERKERGRRKGWIKTVRVRWLEPAVVPLAEAEKKAGIDGPEHDRPKQEAVEKLLKEEAELAVQAGEKRDKFGLSASQIVQKLDWKTMGHPWRLLHKMVEKGLIQQKGTNRNARYAPKGFWKGVLRP